MGPRLSAGKKVSAPTIKMTDTSSTLKSGPVIGKVPRDSGTVFLEARFPAIARMGITAKKRPASMTTPMLALYQSVLALMPANADPLFPAAEVYAYRICEKPCGPGLVIPAVPDFVTTPMAAKIRIIKDDTRIDSTAIFTS